MMAPTRDTVENALIEAQRALAVVYESSYPCCNTVKQGLEGILNQRYGGSQENFTVKFIRPTIVLLEQLKQKDFPLVKSGSVIVHLMAPPNRLENGEMFYQVGHRSPGTLAVKFTKYEGNDVVMQAGNVLEHELHIAFTPEYIEKMRKLARRMGDQLMRVMLISTENNQGVFAIEKVEVGKVMSVHPPVMETGMPKWSDPEDLPNESIVHSCFEDQAVGDGQTALVSGRQPRECYCKGAENSPYLPLTQAVDDAPLAPNTARHFKLDDVHHTAETIQRNAGFTSVTNQCGDQSGSNPSYPPSAGERLSGASVNNVDYPPTTCAVRGNQSETPNSRAPSDRLAGTIVSNSEYPPMGQAARNNPTEPSTSPSAPDRSSGEGVSNPEYPPMVQAVRDNPSEPGDSPVPTEQFSLMGVNNPEYPPMVQAVRDNPSELTTSPAITEGSFGTGGRNPEYPSMVQAIRDSLPEPATNHTPEDQSSNTNVRNPEYPPLMQAVKDQLSEAVTAQPPEEPSSSASAGNPEYPPLVQAVKTGPVSPSTSQPAEEASSRARARNPAYPPLMQAVNDDPATSGTAQPTEEHPNNASAAAGNPAYPPLVQAVSGTTHSAEEHCIPSGASAATGNPAYPPLIQAVEDNPVASVDGHPFQGNFLISSSPPTSGEPYMLDEGLDLF